MKKLRMLPPSILSGLIAALFAIALYPSTAAAGNCPKESGASYLITNTDANGNFVSRGVVSLHADHTLSVTDSGQGGPTYYFSSQLGSWKPGSDDTATGRTVDFDFSPDNDIAKLDYSFKFESGGKISGSVTITYFPQEADPFGTGGTSGGTIKFTGYEINP